MSIYLGWYDPDKGRPTSEKLQIACDRYERKWGERPNLALVNVADAEGITPPLGVEVRVAGHVAPNTFMVTRETAMEFIAHLPGRGFESDGDDDDDREPWIGECV